MVAFGPSTARSLDRYLRLRRSQPGSDLPALWLGTRGKPLTYEAMYATLRRRAERADPPFKLHPHVTRSTGAVRFRTAGGSVSSLLSLAGWSNIQMAARYIAAAESEIAVAEARCLDLGSASTSYRTGLAQAQAHPRRWLSARCRTRPGPDPSGSAAYRPCSGCRAGMQARGCIWPHGRRARAAGRDLRVSPLRRSRRTARTRPPRCRPTAAQGR